MSNLTGKGKPFHSALDKAAALLKRKVGTGQEFMQELKGLGGIKQAEMDERKLAELMGMPKMTHEQFMTELGNRPVPAIGEKVLSNPTDKDIKEKAQELAYEKFMDDWRYGEDSGLTRKQAEADAKDYAEGHGGSREYLEKAADAFALKNQRTHHDKYTLPGGENYREILIKAPKGGEEFGGVGAHFGGRKNILASMRVKDRMVPDLEGPHSVKVIGGGGFTTVKHKTREDAERFADLKHQGGYRTEIKPMNQKKLLHLEELQSDWHQQGREKGYKSDYESQDEMMRKRDNLYDSRTALVKQALAIEKTGGTAPQELIDQIHGMNDQLRTIEERKDKARNAIPDAPFKKNWEEMALKRLVHHAAENGYHGIVVTPGEAQADRYSLAKQVGYLGYNPEEGHLQAFDHDRRQVFNEKKVPKEKVADYIGKEAAERLFQAPQVMGHHQLEGEDIKVGGEGMKGFYDKKVPNILNSIGKKHGVKTELNGHQIETSPQKETPQIAAPGIGHFPDPIIEPAKTKSAHHFPITEDMRKDIMANGLPLYKEGGNVKAKTTEQMRSELSDKYKPTATKASEALGKHEGKHLKVTQADRTKVGDGFLGGPGFSSLQHVDPDYKGAAWGVNTPSAASKIVNANKGEDSVWSTIIGAPNQHSSNQMVFDMLLKQFKAAIKAGKMTPELRAAFNDRLAAAADNKGKPIFNRGTDISGKNFFKDLDTFDRRRAVADLMGGKAIGGKKGQIFDYDKIMRSTTEPELLDAPTHAIGPRLFKLNGMRSLQPDLHPAFPHILHGEDTGQMYHPVPRDVMLPDFHDMIRKTKGRDVGFMDLTRNTPTQQLTDKFLTQLQKRGYADGGQVSDISQIGAEEAPNMQVKNFVIPHNGAQGSLPMGGVDMSPEQPGQQMLSASTMQPQQSLLPQPQGPQGQPQGQSPLGLTAPPPAGGSNILQMTPQGQAMAAMKQQQPIRRAMGGPVPMQNSPFMSAGHKPLPFMAKVGGSSNMPMNNNYSDNGATDYNMDNIQQLAKGGAVSVASMQKQMKSMAQQISKLTDNLDTMRLALTRNKKAK